MRLAAMLKERKDLFAIMAIVLVTSVFPVDLLTSAPPDRPGSDGQLSGKQGQVLVVKVPVLDRTTSVVGRFLNRRVPFFKNDASSLTNEYVGLIGIDLQDAPGTHELVVDVTTPNEPRRLSYNVLVIKEKYPVQRLTLPKDKVDLDEESVTRVKSEQEQVKIALEKSADERFWSGNFIQPVQGPTTGAFGRLRVINGQSRNPHNGEDIAAPLGADVLAMNDGVVSLTVDHFFSGKGVFLDHGLGLQSMYFHLSEVTVQDGESVKRGQVIGKVGASGRASGPHLHWGVRLNGARVDPLALIKLSFARLPVATQ
ncbi:MAG TPA: M23 family metallopeptidase [Nitrospiraceae bacterium]|nr:M23 family metallopeptidase [Nitrospiraceae bacterium]